MNTERFTAEIWRQKILDTDNVELRCRISEINLSIPLNQSFPESFPRELLIDSVQDILRYLIERLEEQRG